MSEVGALIIKLQAETAQFREDMGKVKQDLDDLGNKGGEAGEGMSHGMHEAKGSLMLVEESVGVHLPRHLNALIVQIPGVGAAFAAMLPIVGVIAAITIIAKLIEKHQEMKDEIEKAGQAETVFGTAVQTVFNNLDDKLLQAALKADELSGNHLAALHKQLILIDHQSFKELAQQFDYVAKAADAALAEIKTHWYEAGKGALGAKHAFDEFKVGYDSLLAQGKTEEAARRLKAYADKAKEVLELQKTASSTSSDGSEVAYMKFQHARNELQKEGIGWTEKEVQAQQEVVEAYNATAVVVQKVGEITKAEKAAAVNKEVHNVLADEASMQKIVTAGVDQHAAALRRLAQTQAETAHAADKGTKPTDDAGVEKQLQAAIQAAKEEHDVAVDAATQTLASKKTLYEADLKAAGTNIEKKKELEAQFKNSTQQYNDAIAQADADSQKRTVVAHAVAAQQKEAIAKEAAKQQEEMADQAVQFEIAMAKIAQSAAEQAAKHTLAMRRDNAKQATELEAKAVTDNAAIELKALDERIKNLDKNNADYLKKLQEFENKKKQITAQAENEITKIRATAEEKQFHDIQKAEERMTTAISQNVAKSIVEQKNMGQAFSALGKQMLEEALANALKMILIGDMQQAKDAGHAAASAFRWVMQDVPFPANAAIAPVAAAAAFAGVMAFEKGGEVPGTGAVPIVAHGGETVVTKALTDQVRNSTSTTTTSKTSNDKHYHIDARGADAGVEQRVMHAIAHAEERAVARSVSAVNDRAKRQR
jgi:hypothetical protein